MIDQVQLDGVLWAVLLGMVSAILIGVLLIYAELQGRK
jgi:hypothetical protein